MLPAIGTKEAIALEIMSKTQLEPSMLPDAMKQYQLLVWHNDWERMFSIYCIWAKARAELVQKDNQYVLLLNKGQDNEIIGYSFNDWGKYEDEDMADIHAIVSEHAKTLLVH